MFSDQSDFDIRCEWGAPGIRAVGSSADVLVIVDVLSFSTCVDVAVSRGAKVFPCRWKDAIASTYATQLEAELAGARGDEGRFSLSPVSMQRATAGMRIALPSPNGSELTMEAAALEKIVLTGCFRNCRTVADYASTLGGTIAVIPAGERWPDGTLRPAVEDLAGAGAILANLPGRLSPEALAAVGAWNAVKNDLTRFLTACASGRELIQKGFEKDVTIAAEFNASKTIPRYRELAFVHPSK
jgi:2-phosphosulfolactate phosphatase